MKIVPIVFLAISTGAFVLPQNMFQPFQPSFDSINNEIDQPTTTTLPITYRKCYKLTHIDRGEIKRFIPHGGHGGHGGFFWEPLLFDEDTPPRTFQVCGDYKSGCPSPEGNVTDGGSFYLNWLSKEWGPLVLKANRDKSWYLWPNENSENKDPLVPFKFQAVKDDGDKKGFLRIRGNNTHGFNGLAIVKEYNRNALWNTKGDGFMKFRFDEVECKGDETQHLDVEEHGEL